MNRRQRREAARRLSKNSPVKGKQKQELRRIIANEMLVEPQQLAEADDRRRYPQLWTPPANAADLIRQRLAQGGL